MTKLQAIGFVEQSLTKLCIKDRYGDPVESILASGRMQVYHGKNWDDMVDSFQKSRISPEEYVSRAVTMIAQYKQHRMKMKSERVS